MTTATAQYISPPQYAKRLGVDPSKVLTWIKQGELRAFNAATNLNGQPRFRIPLDAICEFEARRSATAPAEPVRRKRKKQDDSFVKYF